ncbi:hypothetical protein [Gloeothece verrucosa]|uniref:hypothetical protein n=1 Tax=Gloeothece verrucosa TaxID=2546359 RepID=UPI00017E190B
MPDVLDTAINAGCFTTLVDLVNAASMAQALKTEGTFVLLLFSLQQMKPFLSYHQEQ